MPYEVATCTLISHREFPSNLIGEFGEIQQSAVCIERGSANPHTGGAEVAGRATGPRKHTPPSRGKSALDLSDDTRFEPTTIVFRIRSDGSFDLSTLRSPDLDTA